MTTLKDKLDARQEAEQRKMEQAARNYAAIDSSDPFAYARAMSHIKSGVAGFRVDNGERTPAYWSADDKGRNLQHP